MLKQTNGLIPQWCSDSECDYSGERLIDLGYGYPVCPSSPIYKPMLEMDSEYLVCDER